MEARDCKFYQQDGVHKTGCTYQPEAGQGGFTLLELLVVIAILAAISFIAAGTYRGVGQHADERLVRAEMQQIAKALRQFKQDTGYFPREGVFKLEDDGGSVKPASLPVHTGTDDEWFYSPANLHQLLATTSPLAGSGHQLTTWDEETGRGWRGPYLIGFSDGRVNIGYALNPIDPDGADTVAGDPTTGDPVNVVGVADPFEHGVVNGKFGWDSVSAGEPWGRPYLFFQTAASPAHWQLVSMGPDGEYDQGGDDDIVLPIE
ncbi:type II secretion system protein [Desulfobulbus sp.]|uniref:type II secretion system protein n=1 Tax=Desulfobulbus sp. TaxID=895 RepID=UPI0027BA8B8E|nr:prepilin-type N-terminal cleavage/methylation domain-containing protein [Desulfobulbus sp.]